MMSSSRLSKILENHLNQNIKFTEISKRVRSISHPLISMTRDLRNLTQARNKEYHLGVIVLFGKRIRAELPFRFLEAFKILLSLIIDQCTLNSR